MVRKRKKKIKPQQKNKTKIQQLSTEEPISKAELASENIIRLKLSTRKGTRIESVPAKKLEKVSKNEKLYWKLEGDWLILVGIPN